MPYSSPVLFFICTIGVFNGFLVSIYFLFFNRIKRDQNLLFGLMLLLLSIRIGKSVYKLFSRVEEIDLMIMQVGLSACFLIGWTTYFYLKSILENSNAIKTSWKIHFLILILMILLVGLLYPYGSNERLWIKFFVPIIYSVWGLYLLLSGILIKDILMKVILNYKNSITIERWMTAVLIGNIIVYCSYIIGYFYLYLVGTITFSVLFYIILIILIPHKNRNTIFYGKTSYSTTKITENEAIHLLSSLNKLMVENELYKDSKLRISAVAELLAISPHKLSQLLNDNLGKSYTIYVNSFRVDEAKRLIISNRNHTVEAIGFDSGFSSKSSFYAIFKKTVGQTPSEYKKQFDKNHPVL